MKKCLLALIWSTFFFSGSAWAITGDVNDDDAVTLADAITALQVVAGMTDLTVNTAEDVYVTSTKAIGLSEAIYALREASTPVEAGQARAVLGPLAGAAVNVYRLTDLSTPVYSTTTDAQGYFATLLAGINPTEYVLVAVSGGQDTDADDDGMTDAIPTPNSGTIHALMTAYQFNAGGFQVTAISDIVWQYTKNLVGEVDGSGLKTRLDDLAKTFFVSDLNGNGNIDAEDVLAFIPSDLFHQDGLNFDFQILFTDNADGYSIIEAYHDNLKDILPLLLEEKFWAELTLYPSVDASFEKVKIEVAPFGRGQVTSDIGNIDIDSERPDPSQNVFYNFFEQDAAGKVVLTATPTIETEILSWDGCDTISEDKTQCERTLGNNQLITVSFGYKETILNDGVTVVDLSTATVEVGIDQVILDVTANAEDTEMMAKLASLTTGDIVVGGANGGFLRKVVSIQQVSDDNYILTTEDATLEEVIAQGTGIFSKQMTHGDLVEEPISSARGRTIAGFKGVDGVRLIPSDEEDTVFTIKIGDSRERTSLNTGGSLKWENPENNISIEVKGTVAIDINFDTGVSFSWLPPGLEHFKFIPEISASESLDISIGGEIELSNFKKEIAVLRFKSFLFNIGPIPVWITPQVKIILGVTAQAEGKVSANITFSQIAQGGIIYNRDSNLKKVKSFSSSRNFSPPQAQFSVEAKPFINTTPILYFYSVTGPAFDLEGYLKFKGDYDRTLQKDCRGNLSVSAYWGFEAGFKWSVDKAKKLGNWTAKIDDINFNLYKAEKLLGKWSSTNKITNSLGMTFNLIPSGTFLMGSPANEVGRDSDEMSHQVTLTKSFYMQTTEVTQGQWMAIMGYNPSYFSACGEKCPVEQISWEDTQIFIEALNQLGEGAYRLPTEAEWEYAARADSTTAFANGAFATLDCSSFDGYGGCESCDCDTDPILSEIGWYCVNSAVAYEPAWNATVCTHSICYSGLGGARFCHCTECSDVGLKGPHSVAQKRPNCWGLYDMHGNVSEWCQDWYGDYSVENASDPNGPISGSEKVIRGGSWHSSRKLCRSASRSHMEPSSKDFSNGLRLVFSPN